MNFLLLALQNSSDLDAASLSEACIDSEKNKTSLLQTLLHQGLCTDSKIAEQCAAFFQIPLLPLDQLEPRQAPQPLIDWIQQKKFQILVLKQAHHQIEIAISDPNLFPALALIEFNFGYHLKIFFSPQPLLIRHLHRQQTAGRYQQLLTQAEKTEDSNPEIVRWIEEIISDAIHRQASDIHFEPFEHAYHIRMRIDGVLHEIVQPPKNLANAINSTLKIMGNLNIAERRLPQDGRLSFTTHKNISRDCRLSSCPTLFGEKMVLRILENRPTLLKFEQLGLSPFDQALLQQAIAQPQGLILVTGPTGSGKTVTLYTALAALNTGAKNISTVEDPVEIKLPGVNQVSVNPAAGLDFARTLRTFLRQDPDVIMIGEIRDLETAEIALKAAETGHLVLATLHTNSTLETIQRLKHMGIDHYATLSATLIILAQRLLRKLCTHCKVKNNYSDIFLKKFHFGKNSVTQPTAGNDNNPSTPHSFFTAKGCTHCYGGYIGRLAIYECLPIQLGKGVGDFVMHADALDVVQLAKKRTCSLRDAAIAKAIEGVTSLEEVLRVT